MSNVRNYCDIVYLSSTVTLRSFGCCFVYVYNMWCCSDGSYELCRLVTLSANSWHTWCLLPVVFSTKLLLMLFLILRLVPLSVSKQLFPIKPWSIKGKSLSAAFSSIDNTFFGRFESHMRKMQQLNNKYDF